MAVGERNLFVQPSGLNLTKAFNLTCDAAENCAVNMPVES